MRPPFRPGLLEEVQEWGEALKSADAAGRAQFVAWIRRSPEHLQAYLQHLAFEQEMEGLDLQKDVDLAALLRSSSSNVVPLVTGRFLRFTASSRKPFTLTRRYAAALLILVALMSIGFSFWKFLGIEPQSSDYVTGVGEQRRMALPDGSIIELNTQTHVRVTYSERTRDVELVSGEALFSVRHDQKWPFRVRVRSSVVEDVGTQFSIYLRPDNSTMISVLDGRVQLGRGPAGSQPSADGETAGTGQVQQTIQLNAGQAIRLNRAGDVIARTTLNLAEAASWRQHRMWFENATLQEIATEFNRYNTRHILVINDHTVANKRYTATWDPYDPDSFVSYLQNDPALTIDEAEGAITIRGTDVSRK